MAETIRPMQVVKPITFGSFSFSRASDATYYDEDGYRQIAASDVLRLSYDPSTLAYVGAIFEAEATNSLTRSNDFTHVAWTKSGGSMVFDAAQIAPDGTTGAYYFDSTSGADYLSHVNPEVGTATASADIKAKGATDFFQLLGLGSGTTYFLSTGVVNSGFGTIKALPNGWYRISSTGTNTTGYISFLTSSTNDFYIANVQVEAGSVATSFIPTIATAATRAEDIQSDPPSVISSTIAEPEAGRSVYNPATAYAEGDEVSVLSTYNRNYRSLFVGANTGNYPPDNVAGGSPKWLDIGATNRWRMFDNLVGADLQSESTTSIDVSLSIDTPITSAVLLNVIGSTATISMFYDGSVVYENELSLISEISESTWWNYLFERRRQIKSVAVTDLPLYIPCTLRVVVSGAETGDAVALGKLIVGDGATLGFTEYSSAIGITDYSTKEADPFGNYYIQERKFVGTSDLKVVVYPGYEDFVRDTLADVRATPAVYIGNQDYSSLIIFGYYNDFSVLFSTPGSSYCNLTITGI